MRTIERFFNNIEIPEDKNKCWHWMGDVSKYGYGIFWDGDIVIAPHRYIWRLMYGGIKRNKKPYVCHHCDNRTCTNPLHLYLGDYANLYDDAPLLKPKYIIATIPQIWSHI